jgi:hypothetical protein
MARESLYHVMDVEMPSFLYSLKRLLVGRFQNSINPCKDRNVGGNPLEFRQRCDLVYGAHGLRVLAEGKPSVPLGAA